MRTLLAALVALLALGSAPAAWIDHAPSTEIPPILDAPAIGETGIPVPLPLDAPLPTPDIEPLATPVLPTPDATPWLPFDPTSLPLPPPEMAATAAGGLAVALIGFALYSRLARSEILDNKRREEVHALVRDHPGITLTQIAQRTGLGWGTVVYHLDRLERAAYIVTERASGRRCYFPIGAIPRESRASLGALQQETTRDVAAFVASRPGATQSDLCEGLGLSASAASKQVSKLESVGLVRREREWKTVRLHPEPALAQMLA